MCKNCKCHKSQEIITREDLALSLHALGDSDLSTNEILGYLKGMLQARDQDVKAAEAEKATDDLRNNFLSELRELFADYSLRRTFNGFTVSNESWQANPNELVVASVDDETVARLWAD